jgi:hypothetical protein
MACETFADVAEDLPRFIDDVYNFRRLHSELGYVSPQQCEDRNPPTYGQIRSLTPARPEVLIGARSERRSASQRPDWFCFDRVDMWCCFTSGVRISLAAPYI